MCGNTVIKLNPGDTFYLETNSTVTIPIDNCTGTTKSGPTYTDPETGKQYASLAVGVTLLTGCKSSFSQKGSIKITENNRYIVYYFDHGDGPKQIISGFDIIGPDGEKRLIFPADFSRAISVDALVAL